jgi:putative transcriptional regulator
MMTRVETLDATESILEKAGFQISERCTARRSCFDVAVRKKEQLALIKVPTNIGSIHAKCASALQMVSNYFQAAPLFIGEKSREKPLEDDTVYSRYNMYAINLKTLEDITCREICPLVEAGPGGYYVKLDGAKSGKGDRNLVFLSASWRKWLEYPEEPCTVMKTTWLRPQFLPPINLSGY